MAPGENTVNMYALNELIQWIMLNYDQILAMIFIVCVFYNSVYMRQFQVMWQWSNNLITRNQQGRPSSFVSMPLYLITPDRTVFPMNHPQSDKILLSYCSRGHSEKNKNLYLNHYSIERTVKIILKTPIRTLNNLNNVGLVEKMKCEFCNW